MGTNFDETLLSCAATERQLSSHDSRVPALWAERALAEQERNNRLQVWEFELVPLRLEVLAVDIGREEG